MSTSVSMFVILAVFCVFTVTIGAGLLFYQETVHLGDGFSTQPEASLISQMSAIIIFILFLLAGLLFVSGAARWAAKNA
jgi:hypothetical protein